MFVSFCCIFNFSAKICSQTSEHPPPENKRVETQRLQSRNHPYLSWGLRGSCGSRDISAPGAAPAGPGLPSAPFPSPAAPCFRNDISPGEPSQAPKQNQHVYVPRGGFSLIDAARGFCLLLRSVRSQTVYKFSEHPLTIIDVEIYIYMTHI